MCSYACVFCPNEYYGADHQILSMPSSNIYINCRMEKRKVVLATCLPTRLEEKIFLFIENGKTIYLSHLSLTNLENNNKQHTLTLLM